MKKKKESKKWFERPFGIVALSVTATLIAAYLIYFFGWNGPREKKQPAGPLSTQATSSINIPKKTRPLLTYPISLPTVTKKEETASIPAPQQPENARTRKASLTFDGLISEGNGRDGIRIEGDPPDMEFKNTTTKNNKRYGVNIVSVPTDSK
jgi:hypothetical protein